MNIEEIVFTIIISAGNARAKAYEALKFAQKGDFIAAEECLKNAEKEIGNAHKTQTSIIQKEAAGERIDLSVLFIHAQDHLMTAIAEKELILHMIQLYKRIEMLENK